MEERNKVLERFVRLDETRATPGNGLGLSLVNAVAKRHGAGLTLSDNGPGLKIKLDFSTPKALRSKTVDRSASSRTRIANEARSSA